LKKNMHLLCWMCIVLHIKPIWLRKQYFDWPWLQKSNCCYSLFTITIHQALKGLWIDLD
jgi:hypothetical protein